MRSGGGGVKGRERVERIPAAVDEWRSSAGSGEGSMRRGRGGDRRVLSFCSIKGRSASYKKEA